MANKFTTWTTTISTASAAIALILSLYQHYNKEKAEEIAKWQETLIYKIISDGPSKNFDTIKSRYLIEAMQLKEFSLPKSEIQDTTLQLKLLELQKNRLITLLPGNYYKPFIDGPNQQLATMLDMLKTESNRKDAYYILRPRILRLIESTPGLVSTALYQKTKDNKIEISEDDFYNVIFSLRNERFVNKDDQERLWPTYDGEAPVAN